MAEPLDAPAYVEHALMLVRTTPGAVISAGQVAWHAHGKPSGNWHNGARSLAMAADDALYQSGLFQRASFIGGRFSEITLWKLREVRHG